MLQGVQGTGSMDLSMMHKALDYAAEKNMIAAGLAKDLKSSSTKSMEDGKFLGECVLLSQLHSAYWVNELPRIGLLPQPDVSLGTKMKTKFAQWKKSLQLGNANNVTTRSRS